MNPHNFLVQCIKKNNRKKKKKIFVDKNITNFTAIILHGNG